MASLPAPPADPSSSSSSDPPPAGDEPPAPLPWPPMASLIEKLPPRPAPTAGYSWTEWSPTAKLLYSRDAAEANERLSRLQPCALGFDLEWKPSYVKGGQENRVALIQLANDDTIHLIQISAMKEFPSKLREILEDGAYIKAGVGIQGDSKKLFTDWGVSVRSCVDLSLLARTVDGARWRGKYNVSIGLARLIEVYPYRLLGKGKITRSNWEAWLKPAQQQYAANDAHAGFLLYKLLTKMIDENDPPETKYYTFDCVRSYYSEPSGLPWFPVNPKYDPGPAPPPKPRKERPARKGKEKETEETAPQQSSDEPEQSDPSVVTQRHESVLKIAHSTWMRQLDAASAQQQQQEQQQPKDRRNKRPWNQHQNGHPQPFQNGPLRQFNPHHFRNHSLNSVQGPNPTHSAPQSFQSTSPVPHSPPTPNHRPNYHARRPHPPFNPAHPSGSETSLPSSRDQQQSPPLTSGGNPAQRPPRKPRYRKPKSNFAASGPGPTSPAEV